MIIELFIRRSSRLGAKIGLLAALLLSACVAHSPLLVETVESVDGDPVASLVDVMRPVQAPVVGQARDREAPAEPELNEPLPLNIYELTEPDQRVVGHVQIIKARAEDTFSDIARNYALGFDELANANPGVDPWLPGQGTPIVLPTQFVLPDAPQRGIVLNIAAKRLFYYPPENESGSREVITYPIGIGRLGWATPLGTSKVIAKAKDPAWYVPWSVRQEHRELGDPLPAVVPPGEDNPLGHRVLKLNLEGYLIHGTNQPYGVGMRVSHGCVRLYPEHIEILYDATKLGTPVEIVNQPLLGAWHQDHFYVQSHPALADDEVSIDAHIEAVLAAGAARDLERAAELSERAVPYISEARGYPIAVLEDASALKPAMAPLYVSNTVVVDNPVSEEELAELMTQTEEQLANSTKE